MIIHNVDKLNYCSNSRNIKEEIRNSSRYHFYQVDINDYNGIKKIFDTFCVKHVIHMAAQTHVDNSFTNSEDFMYDNVSGTHNLINYLKDYKNMVKFIHMSTDEVYGEIEHGSFIETDKLNPTNPYSSTKACCEMIINGYIYSYKFPCVIVRCNNVYGENQFVEKLIPKFIKSLKEDQKMTIHGNGTSIRSFVNVFDVCTAIDIILRNGKINEIYNIGSNNEYTILEISELLLEFHKNPKNKNTQEFIVHVKDRLYNDKRYSVNCDKLKSLGWKETIDFKNAVRDLYLK